MQGKTERLTDSLYTEFLPLHDNAWNPDINEQKVNNKEILKKEVLL